MSKKYKRRITILFIFLFVLLVLFYLLLQNKIDTVEGNQPLENSIIDSIKQNNPKTIEEVLNKYASKHLKTDKTDIYAEFGKDLYDQNGISNKAYFEKMISELTTLKELNRNSFNLIDEKKSIYIQVLYNASKNKYEIIYNETENFYDTTEGNIYIDLKEPKIVKQKDLILTAPELTALINSNMFLKGIRDTIGEPTDLGNRYTSYKNDSIRLRLLESKVRNIVFTSKYEDEIAYRIKVGTPLEEIMKTYKTISGGGIDKGYIFYRTPDVYAFFYEDEASFYGYSYFENTIFEEYLDTYLQDKDLDKFIQSVSNNWKYFYDKYEYDAQTQTAHITFPSRGVEINIKNNNSLGITLYSNYYLTDKTKEFIRNRKISFIANQDLLEIAEKERRNNK